MNRQIARVRGRSWLPLAWSLLVAAPAFALVFRDGVYVGNGTDLYSYQLPMRALVRSIVADGSFPSWNPYMLGGVPLFAGWQLGVLYPANIVGLALPATQSVQLSMAAHIGWLALGGFALGQVWCRRCPLRWGWPGAISAVVFALSGPTWGHLFAGHVSYVQAWAWTPWIWAAALAVVRRRDARAVTMLAVPIAMQLLAGHPQVSYHTAFGLFFVVGAAALTARADTASAGGRGWLYLVIGGLAGLGLAAVQWIPSAYLAPLLNRNLANLDQLPLSFSAPAASLWTTIAADAFGGTKARLGAFSYHESLGHVGAAAIALGLVGGVSKRLDRTVILGGLGALVLLSLGRHGPLLEALIGVVPGMGSFRVPPRWLAPAIGLLALLAASAVADADDVKERSNLRWLAAALAVTAAGWLAWQANALDDPRGWWRPLLAKAKRYSPAVVDAAAAATRQELLWTAAVVAIVGVAARWPTSRKRIVVAAVLIAVAEGWVFAGVHVQKRRFVTESAVKWPQALVDGVARTSGSGRAATMSRLRQANWGGAVDVASAGGYEPAVPEWTNRYANHFAGRRTDRYAVNLQVRRPSPWLDRMAVSALLQRPGDRGARRFARWPVAGRLQPAYMIRRHPAPFDRIAAAQRVLVEPDRVRALERVQHIGRDEVLLDRKLPGAGGAIEIGDIARRVDETTVDVTANDDAIVVVRDAWLDGWRATVDGEPADVALADGLFVAIAVPRGKHRIRLSYSPPGLPLGALVSFAALIGLLVAWRRKPSTGPGKGPNSAPA